MFTAAQSALSSSASLLGRSFASLGSFASLTPNPHYKSPPQQLDYALSFSALSKNMLLPSVFCWSYGGQHVFLAGSFNNWTAKIPMVKSTSDFSLILDMPPGTYEYRYIVDDKWECAPDQNIIVDQHGQLTNSVQISLNISDESSNHLMCSNQNLSKNVPLVNDGYSQDIPIDNYENDPYLLPPQLGLMSSLPLNNEQINSWPYVTLNHVFCSSQEDVCITSLAQRYKSTNKVITTIFYAPRKKMFLDSVDEFVAEKNSLIESKKYSYNSQGVSPILVSNEAIVDPFVNLVQSNQNHVSVGLSLFSHDATQPSRSPIIFTKEQISKVSGHDSLPLVSPFASKLAELVAERKSPLVTDEVRQSSVVESTNDDLDLRLNTELIQTVFANDLVIRNQLSTSDDKGCSQTLAPLNNSGQLANVIESYLPSWFKPTLL